MSFFRSIFKTVADVPAWMSLNQIKQQTKSLSQWLKPIFTPRKITHTADFEQMIKRFNLSEKDLKDIMHRFIQYCIFYIIIGILCIAYALYLFLQTHLIAGFITVLVSILVFLKAFSAHFWYFEIKHRKLGCTIQEWFNNRIKDKTND